MLEIRSHFLVSEVKTLSIPPEEYYRKIETQNIRRSQRPAVKHVV